MSSGRIFHWALDTGRRVRELERAADALGPGAARPRTRSPTGSCCRRCAGCSAPDIKLALTGAAPIAPDVLEFFDACGVLILEGYGMTETTAAATLNTRERFRLRHRRPALPGAEVAIADDGEVLMRGPHVFARLLPQRRGHPRDLTDDGWLRSGDLGSIDDDGYLAHHRPQEGPDHHLERQEHQRREPRDARCARSAGSRRPSSTATTGRTSSRCSRSTPTRLPALAARARRRARAEPRWRRTSACTPSWHARSTTVNARFARIEQIKRFDDPRPRPHPGGRRADPDDEGQAGGRLPRVRRASSTPSTSEVIRPARRPAARVPRHSAAAPHRRRRRAAADRAGARCRP